MRAKIDFDSQDFKEVGLLVNWFTEVFKPANKPAYKLYDKLAFKSAFQVRPSLHNAGLQIKPLIWASKLVFKSAVHVSLSSWPTKLAFQVSLSSQPFMSAFHVSLSSQPFKSISSQFQVNFKSSFLVSLSSWSFKLAFQGAFETE